jgi:hypothetical protein
LRPLIYAHFLCIIKKGNISGILQVIREITYRDESSVMGGCKLGSMIQPKLYLLVAGI